MEGIGETKRQKILHWGRNWKGKKKHFKNNTTTPESEKIFRRFVNGKTKTQQRRSRLQMDYLYKKATLWRVLGLSPQKSAGASKIEENNVIVGVIDSGVDSNQPCFCPDKFPDPPDGWKGESDAGRTATSLLRTKKILCCRVYTTQKIAGHDATDKNFHGTKVSALAVGNSVKADFLSFDVPFSGVLPDARMSHYRISPIYPSVGVEAAQAVYDAIKDKVNIINASFHTVPTPSFACSEYRAAKKTKVWFGEAYFSNLFFKATFEAFKENILCVCSAGNEGLIGTVHNDIPWAVTCGACDIPIKYTTEVFGATTMTAYNLNVHEMTESHFLVLECKAWIKGTRTLDPEKVRDKVVVYQKFSSGYRAQEAGAKGMVIALCNRKVMIDGAGPFPLPAAVLFGRLAQDFITHARSGGKCRIYKSKEAPNRSHPSLASFSSRGPSLKSGFFFLKPDICAPGVDLLTPTRDGYTCSSGTSMAAPIVSSVAAFLQKRYPEWTLSAIKSAIMTSAIKMNIKSPLDILGMGAGLISLKGAMDPGLVYDITVKEFESWLDNKIESKNLNLPSFSANLLHDGASITFKRTVTSVFDGSCSYRLDIQTGDQLKVKVNPKKLSFANCGERKSFSVSVEVAKWEKTNQGVMFADLVWVCVDEKSKKLDEKPEGVDEKPSKVDVKPKKVDEKRKPREVRMRIVVI